MCELFDRSYKFKDLPDLNAQFALHWQVIEDMWKKLKPEVAPIHQLLVENSVYEYFRAMFFNRFKNYYIAYYDLEVFWGQFERILYDRYFNILQIYLVIQKIDFDKLVDDALSGNETYHTTRTNNGNYQTQEWAETDEEKMYVITETRDKDRTIGGIRLSALKNVANNGLKLNPFNVLQAFEELFSFILC